MDAREMRGGMGMTMTPQGKLVDVSLEGQLRRARATGQVMNLCPICGPNGKTDPHGYCMHLVGFAVSDTEFEAMVRKKGLFVIEVPRTRQQLPPAFEGDDPEWEDGPPQYSAILTTDIKVKVGSQTRIYRRVGEVQNGPPLPIKRPPTQAEQISALMKQVEELQEQLAERPANKKK